MRRASAANVDSLEMCVGEDLEFESLRQNVVPPYVMLEPFVEAPPGVSIEGQQSLSEDGVHGSVYRLHATQPAHGELVVGFKDILSGRVTHRKAIRIDVDVV